MKHNVPFHHSGHPKGGPLAGEKFGFGPDVRQSFAPMARIDMYPELFQDFNIGIVPLSSSPFNMAKSAIKGMEYAASGIPFVASPTPSYNELRLLGAGSVARRPRDWTNRLTALLDPDERVAASERGYAAVQTLDIATRWSAWHAAYKEALRSF